MGYRSDGLIAIEEENLEYHFIRLGEDWNDIKNEGTLYDYFWVSRSIQINEN